MIDKEYLVKQLKEKDPAKIQELFDKAYQVKLDNVGNKVYLRGIVEISNICRKNCLYCGLRSGNSKVYRYNIPDFEILKAAQYALDEGYGSMLLQSGERQDREFTDRITKLVRQIKHLPKKDDRPDLGITLSLGEQSLEVFQEWFEAGAHRYLIRIESSSEDLYHKIHPNDEIHSFEARKQALVDLKTAGYQVGTGVMIGLPFQTAESLADDLLFFKNIDIDMCGMGPYLEHHDTPLWQYKDMLLSKEDRLILGFKMIALLRLLMPDINISATTALQVLDPLGREKGVLCGANVIMPNMTISSVRNDYSIYDDKPGSEDDSNDSQAQLEANLKKIKVPIGYGQWGDSIHFARRK
ncbi:MAG: [FeFe] hydrogenase H-cluster radical SAM maturase HydE [Bacteroidales bacterium]